MKVHPLTVAYCNPGLLGLGLYRFYKYRSSKVPYATHVVVDGHYPLRNAQYNSKLYEIISKEMVPDLNYMDPGDDIGSAQSQNWALYQMPMADEDCFLNWDPDANMTKPGWDEAMLEVLKADPKVALVHTLTPPVIDHLNKGTLTVEEKVIAGHRVLIPLKEEEYNITFWRWSVIKALRGILQARPYYGMVEAAMWHAIRKHDWYNCYLADFIEEESARPLHDPEFNHWKDLHARTLPEQSFKGKFGEWLQAAYGRKK